MSKPKLLINNKENTILVYIPYIKEKLLWGISFICKQDCKEYCDYINELYNYKPEDKLFVRATSYWNDKDFYDYDRIINWKACKDIEKTIWYTKDEIELEDINE